MSTLPSGQCRKNICFLTDIFTVGGVESVVIQALHTLSNFYDIDIISLYYRPNQEILGKLPQKVNFISLEIPVTRFRRLVSSLPYFSGIFFNKVLQGRKYDFCIALKPDTMNACYSNRSHFHIYWCHNDYHTAYANPNGRRSPMHAIKKFLLKKTYQKHNAVWTVTEGISKDLSQAFQLTNISPLPNPINCAQILQMSTQPCEETFPQDFTNVVYLGRLAPEKGPDRLLRAFAKSGKHMRLYMIGNGPERNSLESIANDLGIGDRVTFLGAKLNPYPYLKQAQLLVCPSHIESFGLVLLEAMLLKVPVITTATTGGKYASQDGQLAHCIPNTDAAIAEALCSFSSEQYRSIYSLNSAQQWSFAHDVAEFNCKLLSLLSGLESSNHN